MAAIKQPTHRANGTFYRDGAHGFVYRWSQFDEWVKSAIPPSELKRMRRVTGFDDEFEC